MLGGVNLPADHEIRMARALVSLTGLSVGDALGERFFQPEGVAEALIAAGATPAPPWPTTDDTEMALAIVDVLAQHGRIDEDALAAGFSRRYMLDRYRGYGGTAHDILRSIGEGRPWREASSEVFGGTGSMGNGGAMRVAPLGAYFADDLQRVIDEARASARPTHAHPDGQAGAIAVAVAAAMAWRMREAPDGAALLAAALEHTPDGPTRDGIAKAVEFYRDGMSQRSAASVLGTGYRVISSDTVPWALLCAARHLSSYESAFWATVAGLGDRDTTCAIVGGIVVLSAGEASIPGPWLAARERLRFAADLA
jgi:ADP-ribosylglycohydrolase